MSKLFISTAMALSFIAMSGPANAQDMSKQDAKVMAEEFMDCAGLYHSMYEILSVESDAESQANAESLKTLNGTAQLAAIVLYAAFEVGDTDAIQGQFQSAKASYSNELNANGVSTMVSSKLDSCLGKVELQNEIVAMAAEVMQ